MFENERIRLRKVTIADAPIYNKWRNDTEVMYSTSPELDQFTLSETEKFIGFITESPNGKSYMIETKEDHQTVGIISLIDINHKDRSAECIIDIGEKEKWGQGIGRDAFELLLNYAFNELNFHRLSLRVFSFNRRAITLYKKLGFKEEGVMREAFYRSGQWHDIHVMGVLKREYMSDTQ
ncbi:GNAT family N-acetyltransferase [Vagococcus fluvialis]|uniref:GNAT family N-acetyltransferase n=1 Tax=Vagococcus fluvialis TaxID=2738 RepID=UPI001432E3D9|nr:GNAT family protein [Vagococcus fluvialis]NKC60610.1 GNAT family N-acetyltransferase [Vagococcus fluvialis]NKD51406.1 GNAT family N-acetyltransferase [Vagococcus fluvialis]UDM74412.1 GNAT family N-acetyltransferase [Vagococcus fluvialis]